MMWGCEGIGYNGIIKGKQGGWVVSMIQGCFLHQTGILPQHWEAWNLSFALVHGIGFTRSISSSNNQQTSTNMGLRQGNQPVITSLYFKTLSQAGFNLYHTKSQPTSFPGASTMARYPAMLASGFV